MTNDENAKEREKGGANSAFVIRHSSSGIALVLVLGFLVLITVLIVAYFTSVTTESAVTRTYANGASTKFLADSAVNIVMGQIAKATQGVAPGSTNRLTWASQPGMIRTYNDSGSGLAGEDDCYKLYSSPQMVIPSATVQSGSNAVLTAMEADIPRGWNTEPALFTDLNAPVTDASGSSNFPIMDGNNMASMADTSAGGSKVLTYKSSNNTSNPAVPDIEGVYVQPSYPASYTIPTASNPLSPTNTPVPMPVQWLYVLKDGTIISPDPTSSGSTATFQNASALIQSGSNPITGRVAFWTDDESCKLNINTACEGTFYDNPHGNTNTEIQSTTGAKTSGTFGFALSPPATGEYNRYPGHPASTCLSVALGTWLNTRNQKGPPTAYSLTANDDVYLNDLANYEALVPRSGTGGSLCGTVSVATTIAYPDVITPTSRLYDSFDELIFNPSRASNTAAATTLPATLTRPELEELKFFLTANSHAPELTPFNTPKVSLWPQWYGAADRQKLQSTTAQLLAFCSSFGTETTGSSASGKNEYFWEWYGSSVPNNDGGFQSTSSCDSSLDWSAVPRNQQLATYLCNLGNHNIPGYGAAFRSSTKYSDRCFSNIVLECLDYIRSCVDRIDYDDQTYKGTSVVGQYSNGYGLVTWYVAPLMVNDSILPGVSATAPIKGFGYFPVFPEVVLGVGLTSSSTQQPFVAFNSFLCPWSFPAGEPSISASISGLPNAGLAGPDSTWQTTINMPVSARGDSGPGLNLPFRVCLAKTPAGYAFTTIQGVPSGSGSNVVLGGGGQLPIQIALTDGTGRAFQTMSVVFSKKAIGNNGAIAMPTVPNGGQVDPILGANSLFQPGACAARGLECSGTTAARGDWRILGGTVYASSANVPMGSGTVGNLFAPVAGYSGTNQQVHTLRVYAMNATQPIITGTMPTSSIAGTLAPNLTGTTGAALLSSSNYGDVAAPFAPQGLQGAVNANGRPGDWDTGEGVFPDGPYINVADQCDGTPYWNPGGSIGPYFPSESQAYGIDTAFSPNKRIASAIQFGSLPTGVSAAPPGSPQNTPNVQPRPWETLLFCPNPPARQYSNFPPGANTLQDSDHIGFINPPDHLFLQFFTIPVVQPYAISEPFSTAGKVNLNYQLAPFTGIERSTALRGVLKSTMMTGISGYDVAPQQSGTIAYKSFTTYPNELRYNINRDATIAGIEEHYFTQGQIFRYPSEICDVFLVPQTITGASYATGAAPPPVNSGTTLAYDQMLGWWNPTSSTSALSTMCMTGENLREEPYDRIYPRLTTQSNDYTVHCRVQVLQKAPGSSPTVWTENQNMIASEYRGSALIERYIDPNDPALTGTSQGTWDYNTINMNLNSSSGQSPDLSQLYKFRVVSTKKFAP